MPIPNDYKDVCEMLLEATRAGRVKWTDRRGTISVRLRGFDVEVWSGEDDVSHKEFVAVGLRNPINEELIDTWYVEADEKDFPLLQDLWGTARRRAKGVPDKLETLRELLRQGGSVGDA